MPHQHPSTLITFFTPHVKNLYKVWKAFFCWDPVNQPWFPGLHHITCKVRQLRQSSEPDLKGDKLVSESKDRKRVGGSPHKDWRQTRVGCGRGPGSLQSCQPDECLCSKLSQTALWIPKTRGKWQSIHMENNRNLFWAQSRATQHEVHRYASHCSGNKHGFWLGFLRSTRLWLQLPARVQPSLSPSPI